MFETARSPLFFYPSRKKMLSAISAVNYIVATKVTQARVAKKQAVFANLNKGLPIDRRLVLTGIEVVACRVCSSREHSEHANHGCKGANPCTYERVAHDSNRHIVPRLRRLQTFDIVRDDVLRYDQSRTNIYISLQIFNDFLVLAISNQYNWSIDNASHDVLDVRRSHPALIFRQKISYTAFTRTLQPARVNSNIFPIFIFAVPVNEGFFLQIIFDGIVVYAVSIRETIPKKRFKN
mmetsp:Transcript_6544/g.13490  ORF Transcript_6544/g.13490 Transcript_6544/m.13490 type:complete len:236 (-) Transcript_6544:757-1464(-)